MKVISIISSYRKNGNTGQLVSLFEDELQEIAKSQHELLEIEKIFLGHSELKICLGCRVCFEKGEELCPLKDELLFIREKLNEADLVILASPIYVEDVNGIMKNWIDRMAFNCHRPAFSGKTAVAITTSGIGSTNHALKTMKTALMTWGLYVYGQYKFCTGDLMKMEEMRERYHNKIKSMAKDLFNCVKRKNALNPTVYSLIMFKVQQKYWLKNINKHYSVDYQFWSNKGWLEPSCKYFIDIKVNWIKLICSRLLGTIIAIFFI